MGFLSAIKNSRYVILSLAIVLGIVTIANLSPNSLSQTAYSLTSREQKHDVYERETQAPTTSSTKAHRKLNASLKITGKPTEFAGRAFYGDKEVYISRVITVSMVHSYSPYTENRFREMMIDPCKDEHPVFANSPAILRKGNGNIITVMRIWLEKEYWDLHKKKSHNSFSDNYFYMQEFDNDMEPVTPGRLLGIATPTQWTVGDGPIEPRLFTINTTTYITFNTAITQSDLSTIDSTFFWDLTHQKGMIPVITDGQPMTQNAKTSMPRDKHWSAIVDGPRLFMTYNLDPLRVMECDLNKNKPVCHFVHKEGPEDYSFNNNRDSLRGGTPFVLYKYPYYISVAHGTFFRQSTNKTEDRRRYYSSNIVVLKISPEFRVVYLSDNIPMPKESMDVPIVRNKYIAAPFFFPVGLILDDDDSLIVGGHVNDYSSSLFKITGIKSIMDKVINDDSSEVTAGPAFGRLQQYIRERAEQTTGFTFYKS